MYVAELFSMLLRGVDAGVKTVRWKCLSNLGCYCSSPVAVRNPETRRMASVDCTDAQRNNFRRARELCVVLATRLA